MTAIDLSHRTPINARGAIGNSLLPTSHRAAPPRRLLFLNDREAAFIEAAAARLIPADDECPGVIEAGVPNYIDKQLSGAWGAGERSHRSGPWKPGTPSQDYQLPFTPAELFRTALAAIEMELSRAGTPFAAMSMDEQDAYLKDIEAGDKTLGGVPSDIFFSQLLQCTLEGYLSDPACGGNRDMIAWQMMGIPSAYAPYNDMISLHGTHFANGNP